MISPMMRIREKKAYTMPNTAGGNNLEMMGSAASEIRLERADPEARIDALPKKENSRLARLFLQTFILLFIEIKRVCPFFC
jgi:hypothetical protein